MAVLACPLNLSAVEWSGQLEVGVAGGSGERHWTDGGLSTAGRADGAHAELRFGFDHRAESGWAVHASGLARDNGEAGRELGLLEAYLDLGSLAEDGWRLRIGQAFAGTSRENIEAFWQSPYSLSLSALNAWIGEEFRPIGAEWTRRWPRDDGAAFDLAAAVYIGNDTGPAALAWRGYATHHRLSVFGESLPLPRLPAFAADGAFSMQRSDGTQPFGPDLDGRPGWSLRARYDTGTGLRLSAYVTDNRGDQDLHSGDEYAWATRMALIGVDWQFADAWTFLAEVQRGDSLMGFPPGPHVDIRFDAAYLMLSQQRGPWTLSGRLEAFHVADRDGLARDLNLQDGRALTLAAQREFERWRLGVEWQSADIRRPGNRDAGFAVDQGGQRWQAMLRRYF